MGLMKLLVVGLVGGGAAFLYKNREARQAALAIGTDVMDTGLAMMPEKYAGMASKLGLGQRGRTATPSTDTGTVFEGQYTSPSQTTNPPPSTGQV